MGLLPSDPDVSPDTAPRVVGVDSEDADALMSALSSETARRILSTLHEDPAPPSKVADRVDTSLQNTQYHLGRLEDAGAVEVAGTAYSEKGREMDVYAPADSPLVIFAGREEESSGLRAALSRLVGGVGVLAIGSLVVQEVYGEGILPRFGATGGGSADGGDAGSSGGAGAGGTGGAGGAPPADGQATNLSATTTPSTAGTRTPHPGTAEPTTMAAGGGDGGGTATAAPTAGHTTTSGGPSIFDVGTRTPTHAASSTPVATDSATAARTATEAAAGTPTPVQTAAPTAEPTHVVTEAATHTATTAATATPSAHGTATTAVHGTAQAASGLDVGTLPPGVLFFLGGVVVLAVAVAFTSVR